jgi:hypothetical protein
LLYGSSSQVIIEKASRRMKYLSILYMFIILLEIIYSEKEINDNFL